MLKRVNWVRIFKIFCWIISLAGLGVLMGFVEQKKEATLCKEVKILIPGAENFIEREEINAIISNNFGELLGLRLLDINTHEIEEKIAANPYIEFVKVFQDMDGVLHINVVQREPVLRVINSGMQDYYLDKEGYKMPVSSNFTAHVLVANGNIKEQFSGNLEKIETKLLNDLYKTAVFIKQDTLWNAQIEQLYVNEQLDMEFIPRVGMQRILVGSADNLELKMKNLLIFYKKAMPKVGWDAYKTINIKYTNQIIGEKNKIDTTKKAPKIMLVDSLSTPVIDTAALKNTQVKLELHKKINSTTYASLGSRMRKNKSQQIN